MKLALRGFFLWLAEQGGTGGTPTLKMLSDPGIDH